MPETAMSVSVGTIRDRFNYEWTMDPENGFDGDTSWWWARDIRTDPNELIADDCEGGTWSIPFETDGKDTVTYGTPVAVREEFVPIAASVGKQVTALQKRHGQRVIASGLEQPADKHKPDQHTAASSAADNKENDMPEVDMDALRSHLGLDEDASEEQINAALSAEPEGSGEGENDDPEPEGEPKGAEQTPEPVAASAELPDGMVAVPAEKWAEVQSGAKSGAELAATAEVEKRDRTIASAVSDGKIPPSDRKSMENLHASSAESFYRLLTASVDEGGLAKGLVPVEETGNAGEVAASAEAYPDHWLPEVNRAAANA